MKMCEDVCLETVRPAIASLRGVVTKGFQNTCKMQLSDAAACQRIMSVEVEGDQNRLVTTLECLDASRFQRFGTEVKFVQRFLRFYKASAALRLVLITKERKARQITGEYANMVSDVRMSLKRLEAFWDGHCKAHVDTLFPTPDSPNVKGMLASKGRLLDVKLDLSPAAESFRFAAELTKQFENDWILDAQGLIGLLHKDVLPDLSLSTMVGLLTPEFSGVLKALEELECQHNNQENMFATSIIEANKRTEREREVERHRWGGNKVNKRSRLYSRAA